MRRWRGGDEKPLPTKRLLIACIGNIFLGDDGFGVEVARHLVGHPFPAGVTVVDFGIRGLDLAYTLLDDGYDSLVLVDALPRGGAPGTLYLLEPDLGKFSPADEVDAGGVALDAHSMDPVKVLAFARALGAPSIPTLVVGCEPARPDAAGPYDEMQMALSAPVQSAIPAAVRMLDQLVERLLSETGH